MLSRWLRQSWVVLVWWVAVSCSTTDHGKAAAVEAAAGGSTGGDRSTGGASTRGASTDGASTGGTAAGTPSGGDSSGGPDRSGGSRADGGTDDSADDSADEGGAPAGDNGGRDGATDAAGGGSEAGADDGSSAGGAGGAGGSQEGAITFVPGWSVRKRLRPPSGGDFVLEEVLQSFLVAGAPPSRIRSLDAEQTGSSVFNAPGGMYISDFVRHPSGEFSLVLVGDDRRLSLARLGTDLTLLSVSALEDPEVVADPNSSGATELRTRGLGVDAARVGAIGETAVVVVISDENSVIVYRLTFDVTGWSSPQRTLVEPPTGLIPFLPIGGSFDTFNAITVWFRPLLDVDEIGNIYVAVWAGQTRIRSHVELFEDGLEPIPGDPFNDFAQTSDLLLTKLNPDGGRVWSRVIGTPHEDEPYAIRARGASVAVVGRARRFSGEDNTVWDALLSIVASSGDIVGTRTLPLNHSGVLLAVDAMPGGGWLLAGSDGWSQNPSGLSITSFGTKLLLQLERFDAEPVRLPVDAGPRHNEIRTLLVDPAHLWFGGHEDGPIMHTGDNDPSAIYATGVLGKLPWPESAR